MSANAGVAATRQRRYAQTWRSIRRFDRDGRRALVNLGMSLACIACVALALIPLLSILYEASSRGFRSFLRVGFFTERTPIACLSIDPSCNLGGIAPAISGTLALMALASAIALPIGILTGIYMAEYGQNRFGRAVRYAADVLTGIPSIVMGLFIYTVFLTLATHPVHLGAWTIAFPLHDVLSALTGAIALSVIMIPIIARTCEEALRLVPNSIREAAYAIGLPKHRTVLRIVLSSGRAGVITGALLATARCAGETAPLLVTVGGSYFGFAGYDQRVTALPLTIFSLANQPYSNYQSLAWGAALFLVLLMLGISVAARLALGSRFGNLSRRR